MTVHEETIGSFTVKIVHDPDPENPRTAWDQIGTIIYSSSRYNLGDINCDIDQHLYGLCTDIHSDFPEEQFEEHGWKILEKYYHIFPVYAYIHSGISISTGAFSCPWDSGQSGFIYCSKERMKNEIGNYTEERGDEVLESEIKVFDRYLQGEVYGWEVEDEDGDTVDSCWGYYEDYDGYPLGCARESARYCQSKLEELELETSLAEVWP